MNQPKLYSKHNYLQTRDNIYVLENYLNLVQWKNDSDQVLDLGCGEGYTTSEILLPKLPKTLRKLSGCDLSEPMVKYAKNRRHDTRLDFFQLNVAEGNICDKYLEGFDHVFSFYCLHWVPNQKKAFENIYNLLKPGGDILLSFLGTIPIFDIYENISKNIQWAPYFREEMISPYHNCKNPENMIKKILTETGFENCKCIIEDRRFVFDSWTQLKNAVIAVNPTLQELEENEKSQYIEDFTEEVRKVFGYKLKLCENNNEESVPVDYKLIIVYAEKPKSSSY